MRSLTAPATSSIGTLRIDPVLVKEIDGVDLETLQRGFGDFLDMFRPAVEVGPFAAARPV